MQIEFHLIRNDADVNVLCEIRFNRRQNDCPCCRITFDDSVYDL
jgi:hypothetical protein